MKREVKTKFFTFNQNNSGGSFERDAAKGIGEWVVIEALNPAHANTTAESLGIYFNGCEDGQDCPCCGDRWSAQSYDEKGDDAPSIFGTPVEEEEKSAYRNNVFVHYLDGTFKCIELQEKSTV